MERCGATICWDWGLGPVLARKTFNIGFAPPITILLFRLKLSVSDHEKPFYSRH